MRFAALLPIARADFLERVRRYSFLVTLAFTVYAAYAFLPPNHSRYATLQFGGHRGVYNSAWVGSLVAMMSAVFLSYAGFYVVKNAVERDRRTGVGQILAATPITRIEYALGKALSNFAVLATMVLVLALCSIVMQQLLGEDRHVDLLALLAPFAFVTLPLMAVVAAVTVLFEMIPALRGGLGNFAYFFLWIGSLSHSLIRLNARTEWLDPTGMAGILASIKTTCAANFSDYSERLGVSMGFNFKSHGQTWDFTTFTWNGMSWSIESAIGRLLWVAVAIAIALIAARLFDRFDETRGVREHGRGARRAAGQAAAKGPGAGVGVAALEELTANESTTAGVSPHAAPASAHAHASAASVTRAPRAFRFLPMLRAELAIMFKGRSRWWYAVAATLVIISLFVPLAAARMPVLVLAWIWPALIWSGMGAREARFGTDALLFSCARPVQRQLPAAYLAGVILAAATGGGVALRLALAGDPAGLFAWAVGALFIPALALALGVWSGGSKLFEILYLLLWYAGPMNRVAAIDYTGAAPGAARSATPWTFLAVTAALLALAALMRARQSRR